MWNENHSYVPLKIQSRKPPLYHITLRTIICEVILILIVVGFKGLSLKKHLTLEQEHAQRNNKLHVIGGQNQVLDQLYQTKRHMPFLIFALIKIIWQQL